MSNQCGCDKASGSSASRTGGSKRSIERSGGTRLQYGTVLDNTTGIAGKVTKVDGTAHIIEVKSLTTNGSSIVATLEEGLPDLFTDASVAVDDFVFCAVVPNELLAKSEIKGVCFWIINFGSTRGPDGFAAAITGALDAAAKRRLGGRLSGRLESYSPACTIAALKALLSADFATKANELIADGYLPIDFECCPGAMDTTYTGYILVAFRFRNVVSHERIIVVPVKLNTWAAADGLTSNVGPVREVDPASSPCNRSEAIATMSDCATVTIEDGEACLNVPYAGNICISVPSWVPNGTVAEACYKVCKEFGVPCGVEVWINALGQEVASNSWGCC